MIKQEYLKISLIFLYLYYNVAEPPKRLGLGALIFVAKQLGPKLARTCSSSSEASIKATLFQDRADNTHTKMSTEITTQNISYISEWLQRKINLLQTKFRKVKYYRVQLLKLFKSHCFSRSSKRRLTKGCDALIKPVRKHHSVGGWSALAEGPSHSTDQPGGKVQGQVRLAIISSKLVPENSATSKTEYTNTQQDLPVTGYNLVR